MKSGTRSNPKAALYKIHSAIKSTQTALENALRDQPVRLRFLYTPTRSLSVTKETCFRTRNAFRERAPASDYNYEGLALLRNVQDKAAESYILKREKKKARKIALTQERHAENAFGEWNGVRRRVRCLLKRTTYLRRLQAAQSRVPEHMLFNDEELPQPSTLMNAFAREPS
ncbi:hypothetical protein Trydic_g10233 [Trypoxylus dichotomus]